MERVVGLCYTLKIFTWEIPIALLAILANIKDSLTTREYLKVKLFDFRYFRSDGARKVYEAYIANNMSTDAHVSHGSWPVVINALNKRFLTRNMLQEAHDPVNRASQRWDDDKLDFEKQISKATW